MSKYQKLVRNKIPQIIKNNGENPITRILDNEEYKLELNKKLQEEVNEVLCVNNTEELFEELADVLEVLKAIANLENKSLEDIINIMNNKNEKRGGFEEKIFLVDVEKDDNNV